MTKWRTLPHMVGQWCSLYLQGRTEDALKNSSYLEHIDNGNLTRYLQEIEVGCDEDRNYWHRECTRIYEYLRDNGHIGGNHE